MPNAMTLQYILIHALQLCLCLFVTLFGDIICKYGDTNDAGSCSLLYFGI